ncbi:1-acyl-sn-glycerol-3-phosphate acyltransferase [Nevskia sp.]|uniref:1-acyl-sn-glycerol-3-phosphate acyltransferase n=1 Tax=Nevskia sp. TaxID=1929292 RepID=UPI0025D1A502|nr:1-acyl-sn-glycerol-3-phosphate acyltransferase [Nevskia sp.]
MNLLRELIASTPLAPLLEARRLARQPRFRAEIEALAAKLDRPVEAVAHDAEARLREMVTVKAEGWTWLWDHAMGPAHTRAFTVDADSAAVARLKELNQKHALVFLPSHRSYADVFVTSKVMREHGARRTRVLGGDNLAFFPLGPIARHSGGVFIRRSFGDDSIYKAMLREYLTHLVANGENLEWYMEGGRSRTGKLRPPKYGLLSYLVHAIRSGAAKDVILVPTSICYDQLHEVRAMMDQESSGVKPKEGLPWLIDYARMQGTWIGHVHLRFGTPMSLAERIAETGDDRERAPQQAKFLVEKTAFEVFKRINLATPVTTQALATLALLTSGDRALTLDEVHRRTVPLLDYLRARSVPVSQVEALRHHEGVLDTLASLVDTSVVERFRAGAEPVYRIAPGQHAVAAYYRNSALHWFINRAILELAMWKAARSGADDLVKAGKQETLALRDLLKFEFIFSDRAGFRDELLTESDLFDPEWRQRLATAEQRLAMIAEAPFLIAPTVLPTFLEAHFVVADRLTALAPAVAIRNAEFIDSCMAVGRQYLLQRRIVHPECLSRELFANALKLAANRGLVAPGDAELSLRRSAFAQECEGHVRAVNALGELRQRPVSLPVGVLS